MANKRTRVNNKENTAKVSLIFALTEHLDYHGLYDAYKTPRRKTATGKDVAGASVASHAPDPLPQVSPPVAHDVVPIVALPLPGVPVGLGNAATSAAESVTNIGNTINTSDVNSIAAVGPNAIMVDPSWLERLVQVEGMFSEMVYLWLALTHLQHVRSKRLQPLPQAQPPLLPPLLRPQLMS